MEAAGSLWRPLENFSLFGGFLGIFLHSDSRREIKFPGCSQIRDILVVCRATQHPILFKIKHLFLYFLISVFSCLTMSMRL